MFADGTRPKHVIGSNTSEHLKGPSDVHVISRLVLRRFVSGGSESMGMGAKPAVRRRG